MQEGHEDELGRGFGVRRAGEEGLGVLAPEGAEIFDELIEAETAFRGITSR